jgi:uncharacterized membrane protein
MQMASLSELARAVDVGLTVLAHRVLTLLALLMTFALFCWAMFQGSWIHFAIAGAFGMVIFLPVLAAQASRAKLEAPHE